MKQRQRPAPKLRDDQYCIEILFPELRRLEAIARAKRARPHRKPEATR
ncbi:hypothetical protein [Desulfofustis limnaeus]|jgi:hypothetical protein|uniref:Transposase n=1 Tax=Desulfofustis limnaeus TaxID=2740163 RepID=A0ABN6M7D1_9BACT|nr:hypothetical protein [Desulfofustis limnaeus]MDX9894307.1 hypothetical protein [Desulfofustis sp.]BDD88730.1 hypothetical protein DPPLL_30950 [Desulfofustis limnaeus]